MSDDDNIPELSEVERRVLAHLPVWRPHEEQMAAIKIETQGHNRQEAAALTKADRENEIVHGCGASIQSYTVPDMLERLQADEYLPVAIATQIVAEGGEPRKLDSAMVEDELRNLEQRQLAEVNVAGEWMMTEQGKIALTGETEHETLAEKEQRLRDGYEADKARQDAQNTAFDKAAKEAS